MPITLIRADEKFSFGVAEDVAIFYRRLAPAVRRELLRQHTVDGRLNSEPYTAAILERCVIGWTGLLNPDGSEAAFSIAEIANLPINVQEGLIEHIYGEGPRKN